MDIEEWDENALPDEEESVPPVQMVCYFDSLAELRGFIEESWEDLVARGGSANSDPERFGLRVEIDAGLECSVLIYPVVEGEHRLESGVGAGAALLQLRDDGMGSVSPEHLWHFFESLLDDILPWVGSDNRDELSERFAGGERSLELVDPSGRLLEMPNENKSDW